MRDWRLTWRPVCDRKAVTEVTEQSNAKTKLPGEQDIGHEFPIAKELRRTNTPWTSESIHPEEIVILHLLWLLTNFQ
jgi:hypothetical protein